MVWRGIMGGRKTRLIIIRGNMNVVRYINEIWTPEAISFLRRQGPASILQHGNALPHTAIITRNHLAANNVNVLPWLAVSPGMNPIEHIWDEPGRRVRQQYVKINANGLEAALIREWNNLPFRLIGNYVNSMRRRIIALMAASVGHNRYWSVN